VPRRLEDRLAAIHQLAQDPSAAGAAAELRDALRAKIGILVAAAADVVGEHSLVDLAAELPAAFERLIERPVERDPGCRGKCAIARAFHRLDQWDDVFAKGVRYIQREPVWGGSEDTAAELRGISGLAHAHFARPDALDVLGELLADSERMAREAAARGLGDAGRPDATGLLRYKALVGDDEAEVQVAVFSSLLALDPASVPFVARFLGHAETIADSAALALGQSRIEAAVPVLIQWCGDSLAATRARVGYLALALLRLEPAVSHLLEVIRSGAVADSRAALAALATFRDDPTLTARVLEAAAAHRSATVLAEARKAFDLGSAR